MAQGIDLSAAIQQQDALQDDTAEPERGSRTLRDLKGIFLASEHHR